MRALATGLLALMAAIFLVTRLAPASWVWTGYVGAFAEAGLVGACADWFAVTALFRRPLGLPIPHTGIIPRNKDRIGEALGDFIANNFLTPAVLEQRLARLEPARRLADWLSAPQHTAGLAARLAALTPDLTGAGVALRAVLTEGLQRTAAARPLAPLASRLLAWLWRDPGVQNLVNRAVESLAGYVGGQEQFIQTQVAGASWKWMPKWLDRMLAEKFTHGLVGAVHGLEDPHHPWREELNLAVEELIARLADDPDYLDRGEALKAKLLADPDLARWLDRLWEELAGRLGGDAGAREEIIAGALARGLAALGGWLSEDAAAREALDRWIRVATRRTLSAQRQAIGGFVAQVVAGWDARGVTDRLELQVGRDLQYIRINGTLVGGLVGLTIYTLARLFS